MYQVKVYFLNGSVLCSTPLRREKADEFSVAFARRKEVLEIYCEPIQESEAKKRYAADAEEWKKLAERNRASKTFDAQKDQVAIAFRNAMLKVSV